MQNEVFKALSHPARRRVLSLLRKGPKLAGELAEAFDIAWPTLSRHLSVLREADLVSADRQGNQILYRVNTSVLEDAASALLALVGTQDDDQDDEDQTKEEAAE